MITQCRCTNASQGCGWLGELGMRLVTTSKYWKMNTRHDSCRSFVFHSLVMYASLTQLGPNDVNMRRCDRLADCSFVLHSIHLITDVQLTQCSKWMKLHTALCLCAQAPGGRVRLSNVTDTYEEHFELTSTKYFFPQPACPHVHLYKMDWLLRRAHLFAVALTDIYVTCVY